MIWIALAIVLSALIVRFELRRLTRGVTVLVAIFENMGNRAADQRGDPPVVSEEQIERIRRM